MKKRKIAKIFLLSSASGTVVDGFSLNPSHLHPHSPRQRHQYGIASRSRSSQSTALYDSESPFTEKPFKTEVESLSGKETFTFDNDSSSFTGGMTFLKIDDESDLNKSSNGVAKIPSTSSSSSSSSSTEATIQPPNFGEGLFWRAIIFVLCGLWASNFAAAKLVMAEPGVDSSLYAVSRFSVAALALIPGSIAAIRRGVIDWDTAKGAAICGSWVSFGYLGQTLGLLSTTASRSCVICTLHCVFVAALVELMRVQDAASKGMEKGFDFIKLVPAAVAVFGVAIVELKGAGGAPNIGDLLSFAQPIGFGMGYIQLEELVRKKPEAGLPISAIKLVMVSLFSFVMFELFPLLHQEPFIPKIPDFTPIISSPLALGGILYTGLVTTALALWVESIAFKRVPATDASIILTTEPLFAALVGAVTLGETFGSSDYVGASLIIGACAVSVLLGEDGHEESI